MILQIVDDNWIDPHDTQNSGFPSAYQAIGAIANDASCGAAPVVRTKSRSQMPPCPATLRRRSNSSQ